MSGIKGKSLKKNLKRAHRLERLASDETRKGLEVKHERWQLECRTQIKKLGPKSRGRG